MISKKVILLILVGTLFFSCHEKLSPLHKAIEDIEYSWTKQQLDDFAEKDIQKASSEIYFDQALDYRNKYFRSPKDSTLLKYFIELGVEHEDHMSGIVFASLHRKLNNKKINLNDLLKPIYDIQNQKKLERKQNSLRANLYYSKYGKGEYVQLRMPVDENKNAFNYVNPDYSDWIFNDSTDMLIKGKIVNKYKAKANKFTFFDLKIISISRNDILVLMEEVVIGDTIRVNLTYNIIEPVGDSSD